MAPLLGAWERASSGLRRAKAEEIARLVSPSFLLCGRRSSRSGSDVVKLISGFRSEVFREAVRAGRGRSKLGLILEARRLVFIRLQSQQKKQRYFYVKSKGIFRKRKTSPRIESRAKYSANAFTHLAFGR